MGLYSEEYAPLNKSVIRSALHLSRTLKEWCMGRLSTKRKIYSVGYSFRSCSRNRLNSSPSMLFFLRRAAITLPFLSIAAMAATAQKVTL